MNRLRAVIKPWPLPRGGVGGGSSGIPQRGRAQRGPRYHRVVRAYFDNIAREPAS
jgi:hypothetical protein